MFMTLFSGSAETPDDAVCIAQWTRADGHAPSGKVTISDTVGGDVSFVLTSTAQTGKQLLGCFPLQLETGDALFRIDEVTFPVGAVAHRHTHAGPGVRHLVLGALRLEADGHEHMVREGDTWFEAAHSPVRAVSLNETGVSAFVRCMVIPAAFAGKSTFALCDPADSELPRLQTTHRYIDHKIYVDAG